MHSCSSWNDHTEGGQRGAPWPNLTVWDTDASPEQGEEGGAAPSSSPFTLSVLGRSPHHIGASLKSDSTPHSASERAAHAGISAVPCQCLSV